MLAEGYSVRDAKDFAYRTTVVSPTRVEGDGISGALYNKNKLDKVFKNNFYAVFHFAAQAGVRYSLINPRAYIESNTLGFFSSDKVFSSSNIFFSLINISCLIFMPISGTNCNENIILFLYLVVLDLLSTNWE